MIIDLSDPFTGTLAGGIVLMIVGGTYHYIVSLVRFNKTDKQLSNVLSELDTLNKDYKAEISNIKKRHSNQLEQSLQLTKNAIALYEEKVEKLIHANRPVGLLTPALSPEAFDRYNQQKKKK